ncbi:MAG TPA: dihydrofolate reductase family protein, partial [Polyangiales bacterium]|nr:dihydrofolate reductase family protein [Polyangiales bacterium]
EDVEGGFRYGGWTVPYFDDAVGAAMGESFDEELDLLLGRRTYDIFAAHWPHVSTDPGSSTFDALNADVARKFNAMTKYVATHRPESLAWQNSEALGPDVVAGVRALKEQSGPTLITQGSSELVHLLLAHDLIDELRLLTYPVLLGAGKRLFAGNVSARFEVVRTLTAPSGVIVAHYKRAGDVHTGSFG